MRQDLLDGNIPVRLFYTWWQANARYCNGKDPGAPPPITPLRERLGRNAGIRMLTWRNEENFWCRGTKADQDRMIQKTYREASLDPEARQKGDGKEEERRRESATHQNQPPKTRFGREEEIQVRTANEARKGSSERMKDKAGQQAQPDKASQSASTKSVRGSSRREGSRAGPSAKVDLEN